jgi:uncharacterized membrane protein YfcA
VFALALIVLVAFTVEAMAGFGATVITVTLASHLLPIPEVLAALVPVNMLLSGYLVLRHRDAVSWRHVVRAGLGLMGLGLLVGMALYRAERHGWLKAAFAAFVVVLASIELIRLRRGAGTSSAPLSTGRRVVGLLAAGVIHGIFACGGPLLVYVLGRELPEKARFRATLSAIWLALNGLLVANLVGAGDLGRRSLTTSALLLGSLAGGLFLGEQAHARIDEGRFRQAVYSLLFLAGLSLLARTLFT